MISKKAIFLVCISFVLALGYDIAESRGGSSVHSIQDITVQQWENLAKKKIFFGHQSVGYNILDGIRVIMDENSEIKLNIVEVRNFPSVDMGIFAHSKIGKNEDPASKTDDFVKIMESGIGGKADIAFHKYCFIDINGNTNVEDVFSNYRKKMSYLESEYPETRFIHFTLPLTTVQSGPKAWIKKMLGKPVGGVDANVKRNEYNRMLVTTYQGKEPIFDLAQAEATQPDGIRTVFTKNGKQYYALYSGYSSDGGHLNVLGQKKVAEQLLIFLAQIK